MPHISDRSSLLTEIIYTKFADIGQALEEEWDNLAIRMGGSIYCTCSWCRVWWDSYAQIKELRIITYLDQNRLVAVFPLFLDNVRLGPFKVKLARIIGASNPDRVFDPPIDGDFADAYTERLLEYLIVKERCDLIDFGPVSSEWRPREQLISALKHVKRISIDLSEENKGVYTYFCLPNSYDTFISSFSQNQKKNRRKYELKMLSKEHVVEKEIIRHPDLIKDEFPRFVELHTKQWNIVGKPGHFGAWPDAAAFHLNLAVSLARKGRTHLLKVTADGIPVFYQYSYILGNRCYWLLPGKISGNYWQRFSLGPSALVTLIHQAITENIEFIEAGVSHYDYKVKLGAIESGLTSIQIISRNRISKLKTTILKCCFKMINIMYYKIWYRRIQPRLPSLFNFPIWKKWIDFNI